MFSKSIVTPPSPYCVTAPTSCATTVRRTAGRDTRRRNRPMSKVVLFCALLIISRICGRSASSGISCFSVYGTRRSIRSCSESPLGSTSAHSQITQSIRVAWFLSDTNELSSQLT